MSNSIITETKLVTQIIETLKDAEIVKELFHTEDMETFALVQTPGRLEVLPIHSADMDEFISRVAYKKLNSTPNKNDLEKIRGTLSAMARYDGRNREVHIRVAKTEKGIEIDLNNEQGLCALVTPSGWRVGLPEALFYRPRAMRKLSTPLSGGELGIFARYFNTTTPEEIYLLIGAMSYYFRPKGPYPIITFKGPEGSCKSTCMRILKRLIDPSLTEDRSPPESERDLFIAAKFDHVLTLDNLSNINSKFSDALCRLATGASYGRKKNYTDGEEFLIRQCKPIVLNGITDLAKNQDLISRSIIINLAPRDILIDEETFWPQFEQDRPYMFGYLLDCVSHALKGYSLTSINSKIRLSDYARWGVSVFSGLDWPKDFFTNLLEKNQTKSVTEALALDIVANAIQKFIEKNEHWVGTAEELLHRLSMDAFHQLNSKSWPTTPHHLIGHLNRIEKTLPSIGIRYTPHDKSGLSTPFRKILILERIPLKNGKASVFDHIDA
jgi:hypothetical protein